MARKKYQAVKWQGIKDEDLEGTLMIHIRGARLPDPVRQYRFAPPRQYRADFAWPDLNLIVEVEGGVFNRGWHLSISGFLKDIEKYNLASFNGWRLLRFTAKEIHSAVAINLIEKTIARIKEEQNVRRKQDRTAIGEIDPDQQ